MEPVVFFRVEEGLVFLVVCLQGSLVFGPSCVYPFIEAGIVQQERGLYLRNHFHRGLTPVKWDGGCQARDADRHHIGDPPAEAEANHAHLAGAVRMAVQGFIGGDEVFEHLVAVALALQRPPVVIVARVAAQGGQCIGRQGHKTGQGCPTTDVFDMWVQPAVFVHHDDPGQFFGNAGGFGQQAPNGAAPLGRIVGDVAGFEACVVLGYLDLRLVIRHDKAQQRHHGNPPNGVGRQPVHEFPPPDLVVGIGVIEVKYFLLDVFFAQFFHGSTVWPV